MAQRFQNPTPSLRWTIQLLILAIFLVLFITTTYRGGDQINYPINVFFSIDPLAALSTLAASREINAFFWPSLLLAALTLLIGRFFCGWVCPLGTILDLARPCIPAHPTRRVPSKNLKYYLLAIILTVSLFSVNPAGIFDPLSIVVRSLTVVGYPLFSITVHGVLGPLVRWDVPIASGSADALLSAMKTTVLPFHQGYFFLAGLSLAIFLGIIALEAVRPRFWCRYLCPLGALLSLIAGVSFLKRKPAALCARCDKCRQACDTDAFSTDGVFQKGECILTLDCVRQCPKKKVVYSIGRKPKRTGPVMSRRWLVGSLFSGLLMGPLLSIAPVRKLKDTLGIDALIRPPGARDEAAFLSRCIRCSECMMVCPTGGLQPDLTTGGIEGIYCPILVPRVGYCTYRCTLCGQVCPTQAIKTLTIPEKLVTVIGKAYINMDRCLPYAYGVNCAVCQEHCPTADKAIAFKEVPGEVTTDGDQLKKPVVIYDLCIGCGICEFKCPVGGTSAIVVTSMKTQL
ncbi:MAG: 4Fe-4S binding protein [Deltaproteobacteria bacterium]|nr:4Fe-4S binding protein [Candidatus Zymogenaceae bacterium]